MAGGKNKYREQQQQDNSCRAHYGRRKVLFHNRDVLRRHRSFLK